MAFSCVEVWFDIGHESSLRSKATPDGFTHNWEVFVRGADNTDIHHFVDRVVFNLHESFPKPKRVCSKPPYSVKECGYASFVFPIEIYFKNNDEPKKVTYNYDLFLQAGGPFSTTQRQKYTFTNPSEDFRRKLIQGGGVGVMGTDTASFTGNSDRSHSLESPKVFSHSGQKQRPVMMAGLKPKLAGDPTKKNKTKDHGEIRGKTDQFANLFGTPIKKTSKVSPDPKKMSLAPTKPLPPKARIPEKGDRTSLGEKQSSSLSSLSNKSPSSSSSLSSKSKTSAPSSHKDSKKDRESGSKKEERKEKKEKNKERERLKEKQQKRPPSSPPAIPPPAPKQPKEEIKDVKPPKEEIKKSVSDASVSREKSDMKSESKSEKSEKKKKDKKNRDEKERKEKSKDHHEKHSEKRSDKSDRSDKVSSSRSSSKESKEKETSKKSPKPEKVHAPSHSHKEQEKIEKPEKKEKDRHKDKDDKERSKHRHKKRDKKEKESRSKDNESREKEKPKKSLEPKSEERVIETEPTVSVVPEHRNNTFIPSPSLSPSPPPVKCDSPAKPTSIAKQPISKHPLSALLDEMNPGSSDSNMSSFSDEDDSISCPPKKTKTPPVPPQPPPPKVDVEKVKNEKYAKRSSDSAKVSKIPPSVVNRNSESFASTIESVVKQSRSPAFELSNSDDSSVVKDVPPEKPKERKKHRHKETVEKVVKEEAKDSMSSRSITPPPRSITPPPPQLQEVEPVPPVTQPMKEKGKRKRRQNDTKTKEKTSTIASEPDDEPPPKTQSIKSEVKEELDENKTDVQNTLSEMYSKEYLHELQELQRRIMMLQSASEIQKVVDVIEETGQYEVTSSTFDFDLCALDKNTVKRLKECLLAS